MLENTHIILVATIHKLYSMVRRSEPWDLEEPDTNSSGRPVIQDICQMLGCMSRNRIINLTGNLAMPENDEPMDKLVREMEDEPLGQEPVVICEPFHKEQGQQVLQLGDHHAASYSPQSLNIHSDILFVTTPTDDVDVDVDDTLATKQPLPIPNLTFHPCWVNPEQTLAALDEELRLRPELFYFKFEAFPLDQLMFYPTSGQQESE